MKYFHGSLIKLIKQYMHINCMFFVVNGSFSILFYRCFEDFTYYVEIILIYVKEMDLSISIVGCGLFKRKYSYNDSDYSHQRILIFILISNYVVFVIKVNYKFA